MTSGELKTRFVDFFSVAFVVLVVCSKVKVISVVVSVFAVGVVEKSITSMLSIVLV